MRTYLLLILFTLNGFILFSQSDILYRECNDDYQKDKCKLNIYKPISDTKLPVIVWFHGGALRGGEKHIPEELKTGDYIVVAAGYRLSPLVKVNEIIDDAAAAVAWVFNNIDKYNGNTNRIYIAGHSAGGYLCSMIALNKKYLNKYQIDANNIKAVFPYSGQMISHFTYRSTEQGLSELQPTIDEMAPIYNLREDAPKIIITTGDRDLELYGRYEECLYFQRMAKLYKMKDVELYEFKNRDHGTMVEPAHKITIEYISKDN